MWQPISTLNSSNYLSTIKKEHAFLAGGIVGGCILGAGLYAAYKAIKYKGMRMVRNNHADVAKHLYSMSTLNGWKLFDENGSYKIKEVGDLLKYFDQSVRDPITAQENQELRELRDYLRQYKITSKQGINIWDEHIAIHNKMYNIAKKEGKIDEYSNQLHACIKEELGRDIDGVDVYGTTTYYPFRFRMTCLKIPIPIRVLYKVSNDMNLGISLMQGKPCSQIFGSFGCEE
jgi:hypothetical protein